MTSEKPAAEPDAAAPLPRGRSTFGRTLEVLGRGGLPLCFGVLAGFFLAERGFPLIPTLFEIIAATCAVSLVLIALGRWLKGSHVKETPQGLVVRRRIVLALCLGLLAAGARVAFHRAGETVPLTALSPEDYHAGWSQDRDRYLALSRSSDRLLAHLEQPGLLELREGRPLDGDAERVLLEAWQGLLEHALELETLRQLHEDWYRFDPSRLQRDRHVRSFLLMAAAESCLLDRASRFVQLIERSEDAGKFLNAPHESIGLPEDSFSRFQEQLLGAREHARIRATQSYLRFLEIGLAATEELAAAGRLHRQARQHLESLAELGSGDRAERALSSELELLRRKVHRSWLPAQARVAEWMGDVKLRRNGWYLITEEQQAELRERLEPGDVFLSRKNWHLSNVGLPGFWPHAVLYVGAPEELEAWADEEEIRAWLRAETGEETRLIEYLASRWPVAWRAYERGERGEAHVVIEGIADGIVPNTLAHATGDYLVAMRPRLSRLAKAKAIAAAFSHVGKPYDYDFDFATEHALVCTELIWRCYRPSADKPGLRLPLKEVAGRTTLPANDIARLFAEERGREESQFDFVAFLDAHEGRREAFFAEEADFLITHLRTKWDVALD